MREHALRGLPRLIPSSPLRDIDPRVKLVICMATSLAVMLPFERLLASMILYGIVLLWSRLLNQTVHQIWRLKYILIMTVVIPLTIPKNLKVIYPMFTAGSKPV